MHLKHWCLIYTCLSEVVLSEVVRDKTVFKKHLKKLIWRCSTIVLRLLVSVNKFSMSEGLSPLLFHFYSSAFSDLFWLGLPISKSLSGPSWYVPNAWSLFFMCADCISLEWDSKQFCTLLICVYMSKCISTFTCVYTHICVCL